MRVDVLRPWSGPLEAVEGCAVILDVFRASNTILALLASGASEVLLVADLTEALDIKSRHPAWPLLGERGGLPPEGFDGGNSPAAAERMSLSGPVVLTTSAGTQGACRLRRAGRVLVGSFANATAVAEAVRIRSEPRVTLLPMGLEATSPADEDEAAAWYLRDLLAGRRPSVAGIRERLLRSPGADRLRRLGQEDDLDWCLRVDTTSLVPEVVAGTPPRAVVRSTS